MSSLIELRNINKYYYVGKEALHVLNSINFKIEKGDFLAIMGKSGSGKTTLMNSLGLLDKFNNGEYIFNGVDITNISEDERARLRNAYLGFIFQQFHLIDNLSIGQNVELPLLYQNKHKKNDRKNKVKKYLKLVGIEDKINSKPSELSGGQQQRAAIARALINDPYIIFADEPTGALDSENSKQIMEILSSLNKEGKTIIMVTHDKDLVKYATKTIKIIDGKIKEVTN
ncbi:MAG: ABC transporter ATP-binding protein [Clostridiales bacterium]|nr:ABC transporter ATP-binding protein [Clostridiales bacterium]